jgi:hypothetical protein
MFGRDKKSSDAMDESLNFMTKADADEFRKRVARAFGHAGMPVQVHPDHLLASDGQQFGLWNLAVYCHEAERGRKDWDDLIARHVHTMLNPPPSVSTLSDAELLAVIHTRLFPGDGFGEPSGDVRAMGREVLHDVVEMLVADFPETVVSLSETDIAQRDASALWARARANTAAARIDEVAPLTSPGGATITVVMGESFFVASRVMDIEPLLREVFGERGYPHGVVVGVPNRHQVVLHPLDDARSIEAIGTAAHFTAIGFSDSPGGISPLLYWWNGKVFQTVSHIDEDGGLGIVADGPFLDAVNALASR